MNASEKKLAYRCNVSRFSALVNDGDKNLYRSPTADNVKTALERLNAEPLNMGRFDAFILHADAPCLLSPEQKQKRKTKPEGKGKVQTVHVKLPEVTNAKFSKTDSNFITACEKAGIVPSARQASKWRRKTGKAWSMR